MDLPNFIRARNLKTETIDDVRNAAYLWCDNQGIIIGTPKSFPEVAFDCKGAIDKKVRELATASTIPPDPTTKMKTAERIALMSAITTITVLYTNQAKALDLQADAIDIGDYTNGKARQLSTGTTCTITISAAAWTKIEENQGYPEQIKGILAQNPIKILPDGKLKGVRCIKPEPYGWIFSTSSTHRLVDPHTSTSDFPPDALNFSKYEKGH